jgi:Yip1 domain
MGGGESPAPMAKSGRLFGVLFNPKPTFQDIVARPGWVLPLALICALSAVIVGNFSQRNGWRSFLEKEIAKNSSAQRRMESLTPEQREQTLEQQSKVTSVVGYASAIAGPPIAAVIVAAMLGAFNLFCGTKISFLVSFAIVAYSWVPGILGGLIRLIMVSRKDPSLIAIQNPVASNPAVFLSEDSPRWMNSLLQSLDIFSIWTMLLMAVGYSAADPKKVSFGKALATIVGVWAVYLAVKVGFAAVLS